MAIKWYTLVMLVHIFLFFQPIACCKASSQKHVIGTFGEEGLLSSFFAVLNHLAHCEQENKIPVIYWDRQSLYYVDQGLNGADNVWEYYFEPVSDLHYDVDDQIEHKYSFGKKYFFYQKTEQKTRDQACNLIKKYIQFNNVVQQKVDDFYHHHMAAKHIVGIHFRGTDRRKRGLAELEDMVQEALVHAYEDTCFLVASDEQDSLDTIKKLLHGRMVFNYDCYRSTDHRPLHRKISDDYNDGDVQYSRAQAGEDVLVEVALLARCDFLVHTSSSVSTAALYFNPNMPHVCMKATKKLKKPASPN